MKRTPAHDETGEQDTVWKLLDQSPAATPSARFVDETVRAARLAGQPVPWWHSLMAPAPITRLAAAAAAIALAFSLFYSPKADTSPTISHKPDSDQIAQIEQIAEIAETETLIEAIDHMDRFSDTELVCLIGF